jgi:hypothetical protein
MGSIGRRAIPLISEPDQAIIGVSFPGDGWGDNSPAVISQ